MQKKLRLQRADRYAFLVCAQMMSTMVVAYLEGRQAAKWLGCEQGAVPDWDDIVQELSDGTLRHTQVKRQATDFSDDRAKRDYKIPRKKQGDPASSTAPTPVLRDRSAFDESIAALAQWFLPTTVTDGKVRTFTIQVPDRQVKIKHEFEMRNFEEFCALCNLPTTTPSGLEARAKIDATAAHIFVWLTTWCDFTDWAHIHTALRNLKVEVKSLENEIEQSAFSMLERHFFPASAAFDAMLQDLQANVSDAGAATPRQMLAVVSSFRRAESAIWTQYAMEEASLAWGISGCATGHQHGIEDPTQTVPVYWKDCTLSEKRLKVCVKFDHHTLAREPLAPRLMRLALHLRGAAHASISEMKQWNVAVKGVLTSTLGVTSDDFSNLPWIETNDVAYCVDSRQLPGIADTNLECDNFDSAMGRVVWELTKADVNRAIRAMPSGDLQAAVDRLWRKIHPLLDADQSKANALLCGMVSPSSEGLGPLAAMRVGPRTIEILSPGLMMLMVTAVALKRDADIAALVSANDVRVIALRYWGGPSSMTRFARVIVDDDDDITVEDFLGKEVADIVLMSQVRSPTSEVRRVSIASDRASQDSFSAPRRAKLVVTNSKQFQAAVRSGKVENVANLLTLELRLRDVAREQNIIKTQLEK